MEELATAASPRQEPWPALLPRPAGSRTLLFAFVAGLGKLACSTWMLVISSFVSSVPTFAEGVMPNVTLEEGASGLMRFCACDVDTDLHGRRGKKRGALTSDALCSACHEPRDLVGFRRSLNSATGMLPWITLPLSLPGMALRLVRLREWPLRVFQILLWGAVASGILNIIACVIILLPANWDVFTSLCFIGHTFDEKYGVEITTPDALHVAFCTYSALEQQALASGWMLFALELLTVLALAQTLHLPRKLAEGQKDRTKTVSSRLSALSGPITAFDSRTGLTDPDHQDMDIESLRPLSAPWAQAQDDFGLGISLWSGRGSYREGKSSGAEDFEVNLLSARSSASKGRRRSRKPQKAKKKEKVLEEGEVQWDSEDIELSQLFATVGKHHSPRSTRSPRREVSPRRIGRARAWDTAPAALQSLPSADASHSIPPSVGTSLASSKAEGATRSFFHAMKSSAGGLPIHAQDVLDVAKRQAEKDEAAEGDDLADGDFFAFALRVSARFDRRQAARPDSTAHLHESLLTELFHPALPVSPVISRV